MRTELVELVPGERVVQRVTFESDDPAFACAMTMTWSLESLANLAKYVE